MTENDLLSRIKRRLHPVPYPDEIFPSGDFDFLLCRKTGVFGGKYIVAYMKLSHKFSYNEFVEIRTKAQHLTKAMWMFREVGVYFILCGAEDTWKDQAKFIKADSTGLHGIIVQAVHFLDPHSRVSSLSKSSWGSIEFGDVNRVSKIVEEELGRECQ